MTHLGIVGRVVDGAGIWLENDAGSSDCTDDSSIDTVDLDCCYDDGGDDDDDDGDDEDCVDEDFCRPDCGSIEGSPVVGMTMMLVAAVVAVVVVVGDDGGGDRSWFGNDSDPRDRIDFEEEDLGVDM